MQFSVKVDDKDLIKHFEKCQKQLPFILAVGLTKLANEARVQVQRELPSHFEIRNKWTQMGIHTKRAEKNQYPNIYALVGSVDKYMDQHEEGGVRPKKRKAFSLPFTVRKNYHDLIKRGKWPFKLLGGVLPRKPMGRPKGSSNGRKAKAKPFILKYGRFTGIYMRTSGKTTSKYRYKGMRRQKYRLLWRLYSRPIKIKKEPWLVDAVQDTVEFNYVRMMHEAIDRALQ